MGGLAGHMSHLYDNPNLTFKEIEDIFIKASTGELVGTEKTDGQNIFLSYSVKDGNAVAARNISNIKDGGMNAAELAHKFAGRGDLEKSFTDSFNAFEKVVNKIPYEKRIDIFGPDANIWYNAEVQDPRTSNVINYDSPSLTIHRVGHKEFDKESGKALDKNVTDKAEELEAQLEKLQNDVNSTEYKVQFNALKNLESLGNDEALNFALSRLYNLISANGLTKNSTVMDFLTKRVKEVIENTIPDASDDLKTEILKRIFKVKGSNLRTIVKMIDSPELEKKVRAIIGKDKKIVTAGIFPIEDIVHDFSVEMLRGLESAFVLDNKEEVKRLKKEVSRAIKAIENSKSAAAIEILTKQMKKLKDIENVSTAAEGFVFDYDGVSYKFTGNFAPINQLLGLFRYGRGNVPAMNISINEESRDVEEMPNSLKADVAFVPGSFKPPHVGHFELIKSYLKDANKVVVLISDPQKAQSIRFIDMPDGENKIEMTPNASKRVFDLYIKNANLSDRVEVWDIWNDGVTNPMQYIYKWVEKVGNTGDQMSVALGVSTKDAGDEKRFDDMKRDIERKYPNIKLKAIPREPLGTISATDFRDEITSAMTGHGTKNLANFLPDGVDVNDVLEIIAEQPTWLIEASSMAGGNVHGSAGVAEEDSLIREEEEDMKELTINRKEFVEELLLREHIRKALRKLKVSELKNEEHARNNIRNMIQEELKDAPYKNTGINELETLLKKIVPVIEPDYKSLTTAEEQRLSYRAHILNAVQNSLSPSGAASGGHRDDIGVLGLPDEEEFELEEDTNEDINISVDTNSDDKFIDIEGGDKEEQEEETPFSLQGEEETGRNFAAMTWERIETNIIDSYRKLSNEKDRELFYDYLIANLKLYFDKFEDELANMIPEPESDIYDKEQNVENDELSGLENSF